MQVQIKRSRSTMEDNNLFTLPGVSDRRSRSWKQSQFQETTNRRGDRTDKVKPHAKPYSNFVEVTDSSPRQISNMDWARGVKRLVETEYNCNRLAPRPLRKTLDRNYDANSREEVLEMLNVLNDLDSNRSLPSPSQCHKCSWPSICDCKREQIHPRTNAINRNTRDAPKSLSDSVLVRSKAKYSRTRRVDFHISLQELLDDVQEEEHREMHRDQDENINSMDIDNMNFDREHQIQSQSKRIIQMRQAQLRRRAFALDKRSSTSFATIQ